MREESHLLYCRTNYTGFSSQLNELIADQGELAVVIEGSDDQYEITGYCLPSQKIVLTWMRLEIFIWCKDRVVLSQYLDSIGLPVNKSSGTEDESTRSVYKYKPVALKTRTVMQELPPEFRIKKDIIRDSLAECLSLLTLFQLVGILKNIKIELIMCIVEIFFCQKKGN